MQKYISLIMIFIFLTIKAYPSDIEELSFYSTEEIIDIIIEAQNKMPRNEDGLIPINDTLSLLSSVKAGQPPHLLYTYIIHTISFKTFLVPYITATTNKQFHIDLENMFQEYLTSYKNFIRQNDIMEFCNTETATLITNKNITLRKDYLNEDKKTLFTLYVDSSLCKKTFITDESLNKI